MVSRRLGRLACLFILLPAVSTAFAQPAGSLRGMVYDKDFDVPLSGAQVSIAETGAAERTDDTGHYAFGQIAPGAYTVVFSKDGYTRQVKGEVLISPGAVADLDVRLAGEFTEMEEFLVQDLQFGAETEEGLLQLRLENPALMDAISADLMSRAGAGDAAGALRLVAGASVQDGKYAVIRGLPDRYVNSQMNGVRLPTADADKRAVELDQFPAAAIENIQVSKTFTPDQQGDASGGAVNVVLKTIPDEFMFNLSGQYSYDTQVTGRSDFLTYQGGGVNLWGRDTRDIQTKNLGQNWAGAVGVSEDDAPSDYKLSLSTGGKHEFDKGFKLGAFTSLFYERNSEFYDHGIDDQYWVEAPGAGMTPQYIQGAPSTGDFKTQLFDLTRGREGVKWGGLGSLGAETEKHSLTLTYMYTRAAEDVATLAEDTRGKAYYFPGYNPDDPNDPGNQQRDAAPFLRTETLDYTQRTTKTLQLRGRHQLPDPGIKLGHSLELLAPELDWCIAHSSAGFDEPDKRQFGEIWWGPYFNPGFPPYVPPFTDPPVHRPFKPAANFTLGNLQRVWKDITEDSDQYFANAKLPFKQWSDTEGYLKFGVFHDRVERQYNQDSFSNFNDNSADYVGDFDDFWSRHFSSQNHPITAANIDVDYEGEQKISASYIMADVPLNPSFRIIGGARVESTDLGIINDPESEVTWIPPGAGGPVQLNPGDADVAFSQSDVLPSIGFVYTPVAKLTLRGSYSQTVARQTFKELSPIQQQEFLGGDVFIGNPELRMSALQNYDLRADYVPYEGGLLSGSYFFKDIKDPIEYVQRNAGFTYTTAENYPKGRLSGVELEIRQDLKRWWESLEGLSAVANATFISSEVTLPDDEAAQFSDPSIHVRIKTRDMTNAPDHLYNLFLIYDLEKLGLPGTELSVFYTLRGDTLAAGAGQSYGKFVPDVYEKQYGTLNLSVSRKLGERGKLTLQAKNLTDPNIDTVYRSDAIGEDVTKTSYHKGIEFSFSLSARF